MRRLYDFACGFYRGIVQKQWLGIYVCGEDVSIWCCRDGTYVSLAGGSDDLCASLEAYPLWPVFVFFEARQEFFKPMSSRFSLLIYQCRHYFERLTSNPSTSNTHEVTLWSHRGTLSVSIASTSLQDVVKALRDKQRHYSVYSFSALYWRFCQTHLKPKEDPVFDVHIQRSSWWGVLWRRGHLSYARKGTYAQDDGAQLCHDIRETVHYATPILGGARCMVNIRGETPCLEPSLKGLDHQGSPPPPTCSGVISWASPRRLWLMAGGRLPSLEAAGWIYRWKRWLAQNPKGAMVRIFSGSACAFAVFGGYISYQNVRMQRCYDGYVSEHKRLNEQRQIFPISSTDYRNVKQLLCGVGPLTILKKMSPLLKGRFRLRHVSWRTRDAKGPSLVIEVVCAHKPSPRVTQMFQQLVTQLGRTFPKVRVHILQGDAGDADYGGGLSSQMPSETTFLMKLSWPTITQR